MKFMVKFPHNTEFNFPGLPIVIFPADTWVEYLPWWGRNAAVIVDWALANGVATLDLNQQEKDTAQMTEKEGRVHLAGFISWASRFDQ